MALSKALGWVGNAGGNCARKLAFCAAVRRACSCGSSARRALMSLRPKPAITDSVGTMKVSFAFIAAIIPSLAG